jgi:hypothetical protein
MSRRLLPLLAALLPACAAAGAPLQDEHERFEHLEKLTLSLEQHIANLENIVKRQAAQISALEHQHVVPPLPSTAMEQAELQRAHRAAPIDAQSRQTQPSGRRLTQQQGHGRVYVSNDGVLRAQAHSGNVMLEAGEHNATLSSTDGTLSARDLKTAAVHTDTLVADHVNVQTDVQVNGALLASRVAPAAGGDDALRLETQGSERLVSTRVARSESAPTRRRRPSRSPAPFRPTTSRRAACMQARRRFRTLCSPRRRLRRRR